MSKKRKEPAKPNTSANGQVCARCAWPVGACDCKPYEQREETDEELQARYRLPGVMYWRT